MIERSIKVADNNKKNLQVICIYGPFDRFNYGDLLFVKAIKYSFEQFYPSKYNFEFYGMISFDLSHRGGQKGSGFKAMRKNINNTNKGVVIVAGGESIGASWHGLFIFLNKYFAQICRIKLVNRVLLKFKIINVLFSRNSKYAFLINRKDFKTPIKILYNSVGAISFNCFDKFTLNNMPDYFAVRDNLSFKNISNFDSNVKLIPDSAIVISHFENDDYFKLSSNIGSAVLNISSGKYILFQISDWHSQGNLLIIYQQLIELQNKLECKIVLCPFSNLPMHSNNRPLNEIYQYSKGDFIYIDIPSVDEITLLIKNAMYFIGSSLHGVIVSMSYSTPYIGIGINHGKLQSYLNTWSISELSGVWEPSSFKEHVRNLHLESIKAKLKLNFAEQLSLYFKSIKTMHDVIKK